MYEFSHPLGNAVKKARNELGLTQSNVADRIGIDPRTVLNIENYKANPKTEVLYPLVRTLNIDPWEIFYPELQQKNSALRQVQILLLECSDDEIESLLPIFRAALSVMKSKDSSEIV